MAFDIEMIKRVYENFETKVNKARKFLNHPLTLTEKILYAHLADVHVSGGQTVERGEKIGIAGSTGAVKGEALYFEIRYNLEPRDPLLFLGEPQ